MAEKKQSKFDALAVGSVFVANGDRLLKKTSSTTYVEVGAEGMGEFTIEPYVENNIKDVSPKPAPSTDLVAQPGDIARKK